MRHSIKATPIKAIPALALAAILTLGGCAGEGNGLSQEQTGALIGAIAGGLLGAQFGEGRGQTLATITGAALGGYVGSRIGRVLDERDRTLARDAAAQAMESEAGIPVSWANPDSGNSGSVTALADTATPTGTALPDGAECRPFQETIVTRDGRTEQIIGTACRAPDGTWQVL